MRHATAATRVVKQHHRSAETEEGEDADGLAQTVMRGAAAVTRIVTGHHRSADTDSVSGDAGPIHQPSQIEHLTICVKSARGLHHHTEWRPLSNCYCKFQLSKSKMFQTNILHDVGPDPEWNHGPEEIDYEHELKLVFQVYDHYPSHKFDDFLGELVLRRDAFIHSGIAGEFPLVDSHSDDQKEAGFLTVEVQPVTKEQHQKMLRVGTSDLKEAARFDCLIHRDLTNNLDGTSNKHWLLDSSLFRVTVYGAICFNAAQMGLSMDYVGPVWDDVWFACEHGFTALFTIEMLMKIVIMKSRYFQDQWNLLDFFLVWLAILDVWIFGVIIGMSSFGNVSILRVLRIIRVARLARLFKVFKELWMIIKGIIDSLRTMFWVTMVLLLLIYVCSILCVETIGRAKEKYAGYTDNTQEIEDWEGVGDFNPYMYFGTIPRSMYTLLSIALLAEWPQIGRPIIEKQPPMVFFFVLFIIFTTFGVMNVIIGVIVDSTMLAAQSMMEDDEKTEKERKLALLESIRDMVFNLDVNGNGTIDLHEIAEGMELPQVQKLLSDVNLPKAFTASELMYMLNDNGDDELSYSECTRNLFRLIDNDQFQRSCQTTSTINELKAHILSIRREMVSHSTMRRDLLKTRVELKSDVQQVRAAVHELKSNIDLQFQLLRTDLGLGPVPRIMESYAPGNDLGLGPQSGSSVPSPDVQRFGPCGDLGLGLENGIEDLPSPDVQGFKTALNAGDEESLLIPKGQAGAQNDCSIRL